MHKSVTKHFPIYFTHTIRKELGELYAAASIADLAIAMVLFFEPIYFVTVLKWSVTQTLLFFAGVYFFYILLVPLGALAASKKGYGHSLLYSIPFQIGYWLMLFVLPGNMVWAPLAALFFALQKSFFWPAFHADLARYSDKDQRARESSVAWSLIQLTFIIGPFVGGFISNNFGVRALLLVSSAVYFTMFIPVFVGERKSEREAYRFKDTLSYYKRFPKEALAHMGFGEELILYVAWPVFIFTLVPNFFNFGILIAATTLLATLVMLYSGKLSDRGEGRLVLRLGVVFSALAWLGRPLIRGLVSVASIDAILRIGQSLLYIPITAYFYNKANQEKILAYAVFFEQTLSIGKLSAALLGALLYEMTGSFGAIFALAAVFSCLFILLPRRAQKLLSGNILK